MKRREFITLLGGAAIQARCLECPAAYDWPGEIEGGTLALLARLIAR